MKIFTLRRRVTSKKFSLLCAACCSLRIAGLYLRSQISADPGPEGDELAPLVANYAMPKLDCTFLISEFAYRSEWSVLQMFAFAENVKMFQICRLAHG